MENSTTTTRSDKTYFSASLREQAINFLANYEELKANGGHVAEASQEGAASGDIFREKAREQVAAYETFKSRGGELSELGQNCESAPTTPGFSFQDTFGETVKKFMAHCELLKFNGGPNKFGVLEGGFPAAAPLERPSITNSRKKVVGSLGFECVIRGQMMEVTQQCRQGGTPTFSSGVRGEEIKSFSCNIQTLVNLAIGQEFASFWASVWDPNFVVSDPWQKYRIPEDETCHIELAVYRHSQCIKLDKVYHSLSGRLGDRRAFGTKVHLSPFSFNALLWHMPEARLRQVLGRPTMAQKEFLATLIGRATEVRSYYEAQKGRDHRMLRMVLKLGQCVRKGDSDGVLSVLFDGSMEPLVFEEDPKAHQCLREIVCLLPRFIFINRVGLETVGEQQGGNMQCGRVLGAEVLHYGTLFVLTMTAEPHSWEEENAIYECLYHAPMGCPTLNNNILEGYHQWRANHGLTDPKEFWVARNKSREEQDREEQEEEPEEAEGPSQ